MTHTAGPWEILPLNGKYYGTHIQIGRNGGQIVVWTSDEGPTTPSAREIEMGWDEDYGLGNVETAECYANARLIAEAPCLLKVCEKAFDFLGGCDDAMELRGELLAVIRKVRGDA